MSTSSGYHSRTSKPAPSPICPGCGHPYRAGYYADHRKTNIHKRGRRR